MNIRHIVYGHKPRPRTADVGAVVALGFALKLFIVRAVAVNGDTGLYLYDAQQILMGRMQFVDFPSRSPLFEHALAAVVWLGNSPLASARAFMIAISLALGVAVYVFTRQLASHRAGLVAMGLFYLTPFTLVWGAWVKTEQAAALTTLLAFIAAMHVIDREQLPAWAIVSVGTLFAMSYFIRRVAVVHIGAFALFVLWYRYRRGYTARSTLVPAAGVLASAGFALGVGYLLLARGNFGLAWQIFDSHTLALLQSGGQGALGWIHLPDPVPITAEYREVWYARLCQKCGVNTVNVFAKTALVTLPVLIAGLVFARAALRRLDVAVTDTVVPAVIVGAFGWKLVSDYALLGPLASVSLAVFGVSVLAVWLTRPVNLANIYSKKVALPIVVCVALAAGYLYRDRIIYTTYFQDFFPFVAAVGGIALVGWLRENRDTARRVVMALVLLSGAVVAGVQADPYSATKDDVNSQWFTSDLVDAYGEDMDSRYSEPGAVMTVQPLYVIDSERAKPVMDLSRRYYLLRMWPHTDEGASLEDELVALVSAGDAPYAVVDQNMRDVFAFAPELEAAVDEQYCPVDAPLYGETGGQLLVHETHDSNCH